MGLAWKPNPVAVSHRGVKIYHVFKNDDEDTGILRTYLFSTSPSGSDSGSDDTVFDVREAPKWPGEKGDIPTFLRSLIDDLVDKKKSFLSGYILKRARRAKPEPESTVGPLFKTTLVIWSRYKTDNMSLADLGAEADNGAAYCQTQTCEKVEVPEEDPDWDGTEFFGDGS